MPAGAFAMLTRSLHFRSGRFRGSINLARLAASWHAWQSDNAGLASGPRLREGRAHRHYGRLPSTCCWRWFTYAGRSGLVCHRQRDFVSNAGGRFGAWLADVFFSLFGYAAYLFPMMVAYRAWVLFQHRQRAGRASTGRPRPCAPWAWCW